MNGLFSGLRGKRARLLLLAGFACWFLFSLLHPFLHNHVIDGHLDDDCGACLWVVISAGVFIFFAGLCLLFRVFGPREDAFRPVFISRIDFPPPSRSPPLS